METHVLIPPEFVLRLGDPPVVGSTLAPVPISRLLEPMVTVASRSRLSRGQRFHPMQGTVRCGTIHIFSSMTPDDIRSSLGALDEITERDSRKVRQCNWVRFLKVQSGRGQHHNLTSVLTEAGAVLFEAVEDIEPGTELVLQVPDEVASVVKKYRSDLRMLAITRLVIQAASHFMSECPLDLSIALLLRSMSPPNQSTTLSLLKGSSPPSPSLTPAADPASDSGISEDGGVSEEVNNNRIELLKQLLHHHEDLMMELERPSSPDSARSSETGQSGSFSPLIKRLDSAATTTSTPTPTPPSRSTSSSSKKSKKRLLPCGFCGKCFDRPSLLNRHLRTHTGERPHVCDVCQKGFSTSSSLNTHRRIHSGEKPHECQVCGKRFTASSNLYYHRMTHIKEKPHKCDLCQKSFPTPGDLKSHMYIHNGSWPHRCPICDRGFSKVTNLKNHLFLHTGQKPHECGQCGKRFALGCNMKAHMKTHENPEEKPQTAITS